MVIYKNVWDTIYEFTVKVSGYKVILVADFMSWHWGLSLELFH